MKLKNILEKNLKNKVKIDVASNPEFLAQGRAVKDTLEPSRIVIELKMKRQERKC